MRKLLTSLVSAALVLAASSVVAQESDADLAKKLSNPVASLISVPLQSNFDCCIGQQDAARYILNVQPVVPLKLTSDWNVIVRTIMPVIDEGETDLGEGGHLGLGDFTQSFFLSPSKASGLIWGAGPAFLWPTGNAYFGSQKWGVGPTIVLLRQSGPITVGILANQIWSYAGSQHRDPVNSAFLQPFFSYTYPNTTTISINTETTYDWEHHVWTVPINATVAHIYKFGSQRVQLQLGARLYAVSPDGPQAGFRFTTTFLFPR